MQSNGSKRAAEANDTPLKTLAVRKRQERKADGRAIIYYTFPLSPLEPNSAEARLKAKA